MKFLSQPTRNLFFTGKGGVGKTTTASATAVALAEQGKQVLLVSTDPASNLDEVLGLTLTDTPEPVSEVPGLSAMNIDPNAAAAAYRERMVGPYRGLLPEAAVASMEEQLSGACTVEIAAFDEFAKLLGQAQATSDFDHVVFDTAPTGHTLRLLELPAAWGDFLQTNVGGTSCLGPLAGLETQKELYLQTRKALADAALTTIVVVSRPETGALNEAARAAGELHRLGIGNQHLVLNGLFLPHNGDDPLAQAFAERGRQALAAMPVELRDLPRSEVPLSAAGLIGIEGLRHLLRGTAISPVMESEVKTNLPGFTRLMDDLARQKCGVIMTMGKGGVGKTTLAAGIARGLAARGHQVHLTTTDPAAHVAAAVGTAPAGLKVSRIDPKAETQAYAEEVLATVGADLDAAGRQVLEEDLRSPCTEEIAVFRAFAREVAGGAEGFVVVDTAPTGHTLLLLDAAESYHREVSRNLNEIPEAVRHLLPHLRDPSFTRVLLVTLPEATPVHEAAALQDDLRRAQIEPHAWIINQSLAPHNLNDPVLSARRRQEGRYLAEVEQLSSRTYLVPWLAQPEEVPKDL